MSIGRRFLFLTKPVVKLFLCWIFIVRAFGDAAFNLAVNETIDKCISEGDIAIVIDWADSSDDHRDAAKWKESLPRLVTGDKDRNNVLFALYARCCLFSPQDILPVLQDKHIPGFGEVLVDNRARFQTDVPKGILMRYATSRKLSVVSVRISDVGTMLGPAYVFIGIAKPGWKYGDSVSLNEIEFVATDFEHLLWYEKRTDKPSSPEGNGESADNRRSAPRRPPEGPPPAKPGSAPR